MQPSCTLTVAKSYLPYTIYEFKVRSIPFMGPGSGRTGTRKVPALLLAKGYGPHKSGCQTSAGTRPRCL